MSKYIDSDRLRAEIEKLKEEVSIGLNEYEMGYQNGAGEVCDKLLSFIASLRREQSGVEAVVRHYAGVHWAVTDNEQLNAVLKEFEDREKVLIFIQTRKEE